MKLKLTVSLWILICLGAAGAAYNILVEDDAGWPKPSSATVNDDGAIATTTSLSVNLGTSATLVALQQLSANPNTFGTPPELPTGTTGTGGSNWPTNLSFLLVHDDTFAQSRNVVSFQTAGDLYLTDFDFSIPATSSIVGIVVRINAGFFSADTEDGDQIVGEALITSSASTWTDDQAPNDGFGPTEGSYHVPYNDYGIIDIGGPSDLWGETPGTITPAHINSSDFKVQLDFYDTETNDGTAQYWRVKYVEVMVYYEDSPVFNYTMGVAATNVSLLILGFDEWWQCANRIWSYDQLYDRFMVYSSNIRLEDFTNGWLYVGASGDLATSATPTFKHSWLDLDDGTNPHGTTIADMGEWVLLTLHAWNGSFLETFTAEADSDGANVTLYIEQSGGGDLQMIFSDADTPYTLDCTPSPATIVLTAGSDTAPQENFVYIPRSTKTLTASTSDWPSEEHIKIAYLLVPSATYVQSNGCYINQNWNDHRQGTDGQGHIMHIAEHLRRMGAVYFSGCAPTITITTNAGTPDNVDVAVASGIIYQMHKHTYSAIDTGAGGDVHVVNDSTTPYDVITDLNGLLTDANGVSMSGNYFNLVLWGVANQSGEYSPLMINLPTGSYSVLSDATADVDGYDVYAIPTAFIKESSTGFLIARFTFKHSVASGGTWTLEDTVDLRGQTPDIIAGGGGGGVSTTVFPDGSFGLYNTSDATKQGDFDLSGITSGNTRSLAFPDRNGTIGLTDDDVETMATSGGAGTAPVSDGASGLVMTDITTQAEFDAIVPQDLDSVLGYGNSSTNNATISAITLAATEPTITMTDTDSGHDDYIFDLENDVFQITNQTLGCGFYNSAYTYKLLKDDLMEYGAELWLESGDNSSGILKIFDQASTTQYGKISLDGSSNLTIAVPTPATGSIKFAPSGDADDYIQMKTATDISYIGRDDDDDLLQLELGALTVNGTVNTGQGDNELYVMDQNVDTDAAPLFKELTLSEYDAGDSSPKININPIYNDTAIINLGPNSDPDESQIQYNHDTNLMTILTNAATAATLTDSMLTVAGATITGADSTVVDGAISAEDSGGIGLKDDGGNLGLWVEDGGDVGFGTSTPNAKFHLYENGSGAYSFFEGVVSGADGVITGHVYYNNGDSIAAILARRSGADDAGSVTIGTQASTAGGMQTRVTVEYDGSIYMPDVYSDDISGGTYTDLYIDSNGQLGYLSCEESKKIDIRDLTATEIDDLMSSLTIVMHKYVDDATGKENASALVDDWAPVFEYHNIGGVVSYYPTTGTATLDGGTTEIIVTGVSERPMTINWSRVVPYIFAYAQFNRALIDANYTASQEAKSFDEYQDLSAKYRDNVLLGIKK